jgi:cyanophycin synthetase
MVQKTEDSTPAATMALGYRHGLRQPCLVFDLNLRVPSSVPLSRMDDWLRRVFLLDLGALGESKVLVRGRVSAQALGERVLLLAELLLQMGRVPAFEPGRVLSIRASAQTPSQFTLNLAVPCAGGMLRSATIKVHQQVAALLQDWCNGKLRDLAPDAVCERLDAAMIRPLAATVSAGRSTIHLLRVAHASGMPISFLGGGQYLIGWGGRARRLRSSGVDTDSAIGARVAQNKMTAATVLRLAGLPAPEHLLVSSVEQALQAGQRLGWPLVVKPVDRDRGEGVTVGIRDESALRQAFEIARALSQRVLVERMVAGYCHRILLVRGRMLYCVKRLPKSVVGDAQRTVTELVADANAAELIKPWWKRFKPFPDDALAFSLLEQQGLGWDSVPAQGSRVFLRPLQTDPWGGDIEDLTAQIHPDNLDLAVRAARLFGLDVAGIDLITEDITQPWYHTGAILNELNSAPLMGAGPLSVKAIPIYFSQLMPDGGRIPVTVIVGDESAWHQARALQGLSESGGCYLTSHQQTLGPQGQPFALRGASLLERAQSLLLDPAVDELVLLVMNDELLHQGLPVDAIDRLIVHSTSLLDHRNPSVMVPEPEVQRLLKALQDAVGHDGFKS